MELVGFIIGMILSTFVIFYIPFNFFFPNAFSPVKKCMTCGHDGKTVKVVKGSVLIEIALWICFIVPGLIYTLWRLTSKTYACKKCGMDKGLVTKEKSAA